MSINRGQYLSDTFLKELTGLDGCINKLFNSSFNTSSSVKNKDRSERYREAFEAGILDTIKPSKYSNMWHILALCNVIGCSIHQSIPASAAPLLTEGT